jgi:hypothetical protein
MESIPSRIGVLADAVATTSGFEHWHPNRIHASLNELGEWFALAIKTRARTEQELRERREAMPYPVAISRDDLSNRTFSLAMDVAMYLSQVFIENNPNLRWDQQFGNKRFVDYGQPVLVEFQPAPFNPVRMVVTQAYGLVSGDRRPSGLREIYDIWAKNVKS